MSEKYFDNTEKDDGTVALTGDDGNVVRFFHIGTIEYKNEWFVFFQPAEPKEGIDPDEVVIFKLSGEGRDETLIPVTDDDLLSEVYDEFMREMEDEDDETEENSETQNGRVCENCGGCGSKKNENSASCNGCNGCKKDI